MADKDKIAEERRARISCYASRGPGPVYLLPPLVGYMNHDKTKYQAPAYTLVGRWAPDKKADPKAAPPGPYLVKTGLTAKGPYSAPAYTMRPRTKIIERGEIGPGPGAYLPKIPRCNPPAFSLRGRTKILTGAGITSPGPIYLLPPAIGPKIPDKTAAAEVSMKSRHKEQGRGGDTAGFYDIGKPEVVKVRSPQYTLRGRNEPKDPKAVKGYDAGPLSYNLQNKINLIRPTPPAYSMGIRHWECAGTFLTPSDKADNDCATGGDAQCGNAGCNTCPC